MKDHQRPVWIIVFAILLASIAMKAKAQSELSEPSDDQSIKTEPVAAIYGNAEEIESAETLPVPQIATDIDQQSGSELERPEGYTEIEFNGQTFLIEKSKRAIESCSSLASRTPVQTRRSGRPRYASLEASLANFDSDSDPDGWITRVALFDRDDRPVVGPKTVRRITATFELVQRVPTQDFTGYITADVDPVRWTVRLEFDENGVATSKLPLRERLDPLFGWSGAAHPAVGTVGGLYYSTRRGLVRHTDRRHAGDTVVTARDQYRGSQAGLGLPEWGRLKVRIAVPTQGVFSAVSPIRLRPSVLVDTRWPYH